MCLSSCISHHDIIQAWFRQEISRSYPEPYPKDTPNDAYVSVLPGERGGSKYEIGPDMCHICEQSLSSFGKQDPSFANLAKH